MAATPHPITGNSIPDPATRRRNLDGQFSHWQARTLAQHLDAMCERYGDKPFIINEANTYSYNKVRDTSRRLAAGLLHLGIRPGDHIALIMANYPEYVALKFAIARIGAVAVPINYLLKRQELAYIFQQSDARMLITMDQFGDRNYLDDLDILMPEWQKNLPGKKFAQIEHIVVFPTGKKNRDFFELKALEKLGEESDFQNLAAIEKLDFAHSNSDIIYTSGTTGTPKGVMLEHDMILRAAYASAYTSAFQEDWRILFSLPMYHVFGYVECMVASTFVGGAIIPHLCFEPEKMLDDAEKHRATEIIAVPMMTQKLLEIAKTRGFDGSSLVIMFNSGGHSPPGIWQEIRDILGAREIITAYGMSETTASTTCTFPEGNDNFLLTTNGKLKNAGAAGDPNLDGVLAIYKAIDPATGKTLPYGQPGELVVKGLIVTKGYYKKPEETSAAIDSKGWLHTGDVGTISAEGYLKLTGRIKETYRCGGEMVMPTEIEHTLNKHPQIKQAVVVGLPDPKMGEVGCACIISSATTPPDAEAVKQYCAEHLAKFKVPKYYLFMKEGDIPTTATGRPQKFKLVELIEKNNLLQKTG
ncbi:MAG: class I adenylate-forming enzyme family protein [Porticoccaceae bacterium]